MRKCLCADTCSVKTVLKTYSRIDREGVPTVANVYLRAMLLKSTGQRILLPGVLMQAPMELFEELLITLIDSCKQINIL